MVQPGRMPVTIGAGPGRADLGIERAQGACRPSEDWQRMLNSSSARVPGAVDDRRIDGHGERG